MAACGVCHTDLHVIKAEVRFPTPCVLGHEVSGTVVAHGPGLSPTDAARLAVGQRVVGAFIMPCGTCYYCVRGQDGLCETFFTVNRLEGKLYDNDTRLRRADGSPVWMYSMGGLAEYAVIPVTGVAPLAGRAAVRRLGDPGLRGLHGVRGGPAGRGLGRRVGGGGGDGRCRLEHHPDGAGVWRLPDHRHRRPRRQVGGGPRARRHPHVNGSTEDVGARIRDLTDGRGVDVAFEALGRPETFVQAASIVRAGGRAVMVGIAPAGATAPVEITPLVRRGVSIIGSYGASTRADLAEVIALARPARWTCGGPSRAATAWTMPPRRTTR